VCRPLNVLCVAGDPQTLAALKRAAVGAEWELATGAISDAEALTQLEAERPHVLVVFGPFEALCALARERLPAIRIVADRDLPGADAVASSLDEVRTAVTGLAWPGGPAG
jgi:hypothetical protein